MITTFLADWDLAQSVCAVQHSSSYSDLHFRYIGIPTDVTFEKISDSGLLVPLTTQLDPNNATLDAKILSDIRGRLEKSKSAIVILDGGENRAFHWFVYDANSPQGRSGMGFSPKQPGL